jgi:cytidylate kinase
VALVALREGVDLGDGVALAALGRDMALAADGVSYAGERIPEDALSTPEVAAGASEVSAHPELREVLVERQRVAAHGAQESGGAVVEGRDIGTEVLPEAELKVFLSAAPEERARRRALQTGREDELERISEAMQTRDRRDSERKASPLTSARDAVVIDTTCLSLEEVVSWVVELAEKRHRRERRNAPAEGVT